MTKPLKLAAALGALLSLWAVLGLATYGAVVLVQGCR